MLRQVIMLFRMSKPLSELKQKASSYDLNREELWMTSKVDRYRNRPRDGVFSDMCIAIFVSEYRVLSKNEISPNRIILEKDFGFVIRRT